MSSRLGWVSLCAVIILVHLPGPAWGQSAATGANVAEQYLLAAADQERGALGLPPLRWDSALVVAARQHALQMVEHNSISHQFAHEPDLAARGASAGARFSLISENVAESPSAVRIHTAWMNSEGHRHNLLDPNVDAVGIAVIARGTQLFAVEDFERSLRAMSLSQQEAEVAKAVAQAGMTVSQADESARRACAEGQSAGLRQPSFVMRYTTADLGQIPEQLRSQLRTGNYTSAVVAACPAQDSGDFSMYRLAVLLYRARSN